MNIYTKLSEVKKEIGAISKDSTNPFFKSKYFDINGLLKHVEPLLGLQAEDDDANAASKASKLPPAKKFVAKGDKVWNRAVDKGIKLEELLSHYDVSKKNQELYPYK